VPLLGKIPLLGALFSHRAHRDQRSELVVFITPRVVESN
jgi:type IV pilus assembly protein PilQ